MRLEKNAMVVPSMPSKLAIMNWSKSLSEIEEQLCDAEAVGVVRDDKHRDVYHLLLNIAIQDTKDGSEKQMTVYDDYDLKRLSEAKRLVRNLFALLGEVDYPIEDLGDGINFQLSKKESRGIPVLIRIVEGKRQLPQIEVLCRRLGQPGLDR